MLNVGCRMTGAIQHSAFCIQHSRSGLVGLGRFELPTSRLSGVRSNQLSYRPARSISSRSGPLLPQRSIVIEPGGAGSLKTEQDREDRQSLLRFLST